MTAWDRVSVRRRHREFERGAGTILVVGLTLVVLAVCSGAVIAARALTAVEQAARAADLTALAAADAERGVSAGSPCQVAGRTARLNGAQLVSCVIEVPNAIVRVVVRSDTEVWGNRAEGRARAGRPP